MNKRVRIVFMAALAVSSVSTLAAGNIVSRPVGVSAINIPANSQVPVSLPYVPFTPTMDSLLNGQMTNGAGILFWNNLTQKYGQVNRVNGKWVQASATGDVAVIPGDAFYVVNRQQTNQTLLLGGEVSLEGTNVTVLLPGLNLVGLPQSEGVPVAKSGLANMGKDTLLNTQGNAVTNMTPGAAYWYTRNEPGCLAWVEILPYAVDMFPQEGSLPAITGIKVRAPVGSNQVPAVTLEIALAANCKKIDIYYKDQAAIDPVVLDKDWLIADTDLPVSGTNTLEWTDPTASYQSAFGTRNSAFSSRYYLVGNADLVDEKGIPRSRQKFVFGKDIAALPALASADFSSSLTAGRVSLTPLAPSSNRMATIEMPLPVLKIGRVVYVDRVHGGDQLSGKAPVVVGGDGPKKTVKAGLQEAGDEGNTMIIKNGNYSENLPIAGRNVKVYFEGKVSLCGGIGDSVGRQSNNPAPGKDFVMNVTTNIGR